MLGLRRLLASPADRSKKGLWVIISAKNTVFDFGIIHHKLNGCHENWIAASYGSLSFYGMLNINGNYVIRGREDEAGFYGVEYDNKASSSGLFIKNKWIIHKVSKNCNNPLLGFCPWRLELLHNITCEPMCQQTEKQ